MREVRANGQYDIVRKCRREKEEEKIMTEKMERDKKNTREGITEIEVDEGTLKIENRR